MDYSNIIARIDAEIARLEQVRGFLANEPAKRKVGRPKKAVASVVAQPTKAKRKGGMSAEGKAKIAAVQKARWAKIKKITKPQAEPVQRASVVKKTVAKKAVTK
jgi:hypothetical protein